MYYKAKETRHNELWVLKYQRPDGSVIECRREDRAEAREGIKKLLLAEFTELMIHREEIYPPVTGKVDLLPENHFVKLPLSAVLKIAIYKRMIDKNISRMVLTELLNCKDHQVDQLLDLQHWTRCTFMDKALEVLGLEIA